MGNNARPRDATFLSSELASGFVPAGPTPRVRPARSIPESESRAPARGYWPSDTIWTAAAQELGNPRGDATRAQHRKTIGVECMLDFVKGNMCPQRASRQW